MAALDRHRVTWSGFPGSPGVSTFYAPTGSVINAYLRTFFDAIKGSLPTDVTITVQASGDTLESTTGALVGSWTDAGTAPVVGADPAPYSAVSGALVSWGTSTFLSGRRLRGHTYLVPWGGDHYSSFGTIDSGSIASVSAAAGALITSAGGGLTIYQRPRVAQPAYTDRRGVLHPAIVARGGGYAPVVNAVCRELVTELRSRRD